MTRINTLADSYTDEAAAQDGLHPLEVAKTAKERKHREQCAGAGLEYYTLAFSVLGGIAGDFYTKVMLPQHRVKVARAKAAGEDVWKVRAEHERWMARFSILSARCNATAILKAEKRERTDHHPPTPQRDDDLDDIDDEPAWRVGGRTGETDSESGRSSSASA